MSVQSAGDLKRANYAKILSAAKQILASKPADETSLDEIALAAGVSRKTVSNIMGSKGNLVVLTAISTFDELHKCLVDLCADESHLVLSGLEQVMALHIARAKFYEARPYAARLVADIERLTFAGGAELENYRRYASLLLDISDLYQAPLEAGLADGSIKRSIGKEDAYALLFFSFGSIAQHLSNTVGNKTLCDAVQPREIMRHALSATRSFLMSTSPDVAITPAQNNAARTQRTIPGEGMMAETKTILVVEDNQINQNILRHMLEHEGYTVLTAENGQVALDILRAATPAIDLVLLDLVMPVMSGYELLEIMRDEHIIDGTPVIVLTGQGQREAEIRCLEYGVSDFLEKPFDAQVVCRRVSNMLHTIEYVKQTSHPRIDLLTGLLNKEPFFDDARAMLDTEPGTSFCLLYANIEDFKMINAHLGMVAGDELLKFVADELAAGVGDRGICGRIGPDLFMTLMRGDAGEAEVLADHLAARTAKDSPAKGASLKCGIYPIADRTHSLADMSDYAKMAEESVRRHYGESSARYDDDMRVRAMRDHQLANYMEEALEQRQFVVYLQPKHRTIDGVVAGAEALVRWVHPTLGFISPGEFIPLFERNGFISKLDYFVWQEVCSVLRGWLDAGVCAVPISVNASRADFVSSDLPKEIGELVDDYDIPPELLHVEVTESAYTDNPQQIISAVSTLRDMGFKIEMDDFGSGYSSLNMLSELPIDILKLDMRFVQSGSERLKGSKRNILSFIVSLSKWLQLPTVAEGVETKDELEILKSMGCDYIQGYYFAKPMPIADFEAYLRDHAAAPAQPPVPAPVAVVPRAPADEESTRPLILVVEDIETNRAAIRALLSSEYRIDVAKDGAEGYAYIKEHRDELSCILLDLLMPVMDGFQLLELLHNDEQLRDIPVIITTETGNSGELRALNLGAHSFVAKPYNPDVLRHHVRKAVEEHGFIEFKRAYLNQAKQDQGEK